MRKLFLVLAVASGLFLTKVCYGASTLFTWSATNTEEMTAWIGQMWTDMSIPVVIVLGIAIGFIIIRKIISLAKAGAR